ncbi:hypothetical protein [Streptomyces sp. NBC_01443]|uniref:hypothetical protein n=1 Tax=Streptomyces sp. NBC_01443 TaxID=2903868 RepID=UPI0022530F03|nr:hypothetical protein [Streptomyces sp. NBC_01443]MCX4628746.1 hypothetical protein [Streptomyces sp. NBC_01443]
MRTRLLGFTAAVILAVFGAMSPAAHASLPAPDVPTCTQGGGTAEYNAATGQWTCIGGSHNGEPID